MAKLIEQIIAFLAYAEREGSMEETKTCLTEDEDGGAERLDVAPDDGDGFDSWDPMADVTTLYEDNAFKVFQANNPEACEELLNEMKEIYSWHWARVAQEPKKVFFIDDKAWKKRRMCIVNGESAIRFQGNKRSESAATWLSKHGTYGLIKFFIDNKFQYITSFLRTKFGNKSVMASGVYHYPEDKIGSKAYASVVKIEIRKGVKSIPQYAFYDMGRVREVVVPDGVVKIGNSAFGEMQGLKRIVLPDTLKEIGEYAFGSWSPIRRERPLRLFIPKSVRSVGRGICMVSGTDTPPASDVEILCEAESRPEGWDADWDVACGRRWGFYPDGGRDSQTHRYHVTWGAARPAEAEPPRDVNEGCGGDGFLISAERPTPLNDGDVPESVAHAIIDAYFDIHGGEYSGHITPEDARRNCYRPWCRDVVKWWLSSLVDGRVTLMADTADGQTEGIINIEGGELDEILSGMGMCRPRRALDEGEEDGEFILSDAPVDGTVCLRRGVSGPEDDPGAKELIRKFGGKRYWYISLSDGGYDQLDGFDLGGEYARLNTYEDALRLWREYPLEDELGIHVAECPDDYCELHVELRCITDAEFEEEGGAYDDEMAKDGDFSWTESEPVADRCLIYDPGVGE